MGAAAALALAVASALGVASFTGTDLAGAAATRASSLMELLDRRSPGERTEGQLTKTKLRHQILGDRLPAAPAVHAPIELAQMLAPPQGLIPVDIAVSPPAELQFLSPPPPPGSIFFPPGGGGGPPGGGPPGGPGSPPGTPNIPPPAVPEPGTWMTMLAGFGLIGWVLRRRKAQLGLSISR